MKIEINNYKIEYDEYAQRYIVWEIHNNYLLDIYSAKRESTCIKWCKKNNINL